MNIKIVEKEKIDGRTFNAEQRLEKAMQENDVLLAKLDGYVVRHGREQLNKRRLFVYTKNGYSKVKVNNSSKHASFWIDYSYKKGKYFMSEIALLEEHNKVLKEAIDFLNIK